MVRSQIEGIPGRTSRSIRQGRQNVFSWHDFFPPGPAAELGRSAAASLHERNCP